MKRSTNKSEVIIYGHSDDCIEVDGALCEEFSAYDVARYLHFPDGTVVRCEYTGSGQWRIEPVKVGSIGTNAISREEATDDDNYSDVVTIKAKPAWVECWSGEDGPTKHEVAERIKDMVEANDHRECSTGDLLHIYRLLAH